MKRKIGIVFMIAGVVLIAAALLLLVHNKQENDRAGEAAAELLSTVQEAIDDNLATEANAADISSVPISATDNTDDYLGYLTIPTLDITLPVMSDCTYELLKTSPCRQFGTPKSNDLVIAGHNYEKHFGSLGSLKTDDMILFTAMNGETMVYQVMAVTTVEATALDEVQNSAYDLVLYTCTYGGSKRILVGCTKIGVQEPLPILSH